MILLLAFISSPNITIPVLCCFTSHYSFFLSLLACVALCAFWLLPDSGNGGLPLRHSWTRADRRELAGKIASHPELPFPNRRLFIPWRIRSIQQIYQLSRDVYLYVGEDLTGLGPADADKRSRKLIIAMPQSHGVEIRKLISGCRMASIQVHLVPQWYDLYLSKAELLEIDGLPYALAPGAKSPHDKLRAETNHGPCFRLGDFVTGISITGSCALSFTAEGAVHSGQNSVAARTEFLSGCTG